MNPENARLFPFAVRGEGSSANADSEKKAWRRLLAGLFGLIPPEARRSLDRALAERLRVLFGPAEGRTLFGFAALPDEPDLSDLYRWWVAGGGELAMPIWLGGDGMVFRRVDDLDGQLAPGRRGIMEPGADLPVIDPGRPGLVVVPGRAFSEGLDRLGRGAGCYDALLRRRNLTGIGAAYDFQIFPVIPVDAGDVPVDMVATPSRMLGSGKGDDA